MSNIKIIGDKTELVEVADKVRALSGSSNEMSLFEIKSKLDDEQTNIAAALSALTEKGVEVPEGSNSGALAGLIEGIEVGETLQNVEDVEFPFFYMDNGLTFPPIPKEVLEAYPYSVISKSITSGRYNLFVSDTQWYYIEYTSSKGFLKNKSTLIKQYIIETSSLDTATEWTFYKEYENGIQVTISANDSIIIWSKKDILKDSLDSTDVYFASSIPISEEKFYKADCYNISDIAEAICEKNYSQDRIPFNNMATAIRELNVDSAFVEEGVVIPESDMATFGIYSEHYKQALKMPKYLIIRQDFANNEIIKDMTDCFLMFLEILSSEPYNNTDSLYVTCNVFSCGYSNIYGQEAANYRNDYQIITKSMQDKGTLPFFNNIQSPFKAGKTYKWTAIW